MQRRSAAAALFLISVGALACGGAAARPDPGGKRAAAAPRDPLRAIRVTAPDGRPVALGDLGGGDAITVVALWATWCEPCLDEMPRIDDLRLQYAGDRRIRFIAVNVDDEPRVAAGAIERMGLTLPSYRDGAALMNALSPRGADGAPRTGLPLVAVIDWRAHPARAHRRFGYDPDGGSIAGLTEVIEAVRRGGELPPERLLLAADPESPMVLAVPRIPDERERRQHLAGMRADLVRMFPRFTAPQLDRVLERAAEISVEGGNLLISVPADIPLGAARGSGGPVPFY